MDRYRYSIRYQKHILNGKKSRKSVENVKYPGTWVLIWEFSTRAFQWIPTWQGLDGFQKYLRSYALYKSSLSIGRVKVWNLYIWNWLNCYLDISTRRNVQYLFAKFPNLTVLNSTKLGSWDAGIINKNTNKVLFH